jgi:hypothetical protein
MQPASAYLRRFDGEQSVTRSVSSSEAAFGYSLWIVPQFSTSGWLVEGRLTRQSGFWPSR